jgi:hypothetical protein
MKCQKRSKKSLLKYSPARRNQTSCRMEKPCPRRYYWIVQNNINFIQLCNCKEKLLYTPMNIWINPVYIVALFASCYLLYLTHNGPAWHYSQASVMIACFSSLIPTCVSEHGYNGRLITNTHLEWDLILLGVMSPLKSLMYLTYLNYIPPWHATLNVWTKQENLLLETQWNSD